MAAFSSAMDTRRIIYVVINFDDRLHEHVDDYLIQIQKQEKEFVLPGLEIVLDTKPKSHSANPISESSHMLRFTSVASWRPPSAGYQSLSAEL